MKRILILSAFSVLLLSGCEPGTATQDDKDAVKQDTINPRQGEGEGDVGEGVYGN